jgi:hypothetical protein
MMKSTNSRFVAPIKWAFVGFFLSILLVILVEVWVGLLSIVFPFPPFDLSLGSLEILKFSRLEGGFLVESGPILYGFALIVAIGVLVTTFRRQNRHQGK